MDMYMPVRLIGGENGLRAGGAVFKALGQSCLIVTGSRSAVQSGALGQVTDVLEDVGIRYAVFDQIAENPTVSSCKQGGDKAREQAADFIIGIGGGSPLDAAKAVAIFAANPEFDTEDIYKRTVPAKALPVVLIGTTAGTGSEVTGVSVLTDDAVGMKRSISGPDCYAHTAFINPRFTDSMPMGVTVSTGLDALAHAAESWFAPRCTELSRAFSALALPKLYSALFEIYRYDKLPGKSQRDELYEASIYAGLALNLTGAAFPHTIGYVLTEDFGIPHGRACTAFMPALIKRANIFCRDRLWDLYYAMGTDEDEFLEMVTVLTNVRLKIPEEKIAAYCKRWDRKNKNFINSPGGFNEKDAYLVLRDLGN